jgi:hypothetical protein
VKVFSTNASIGGFRAQSSVTMSRRLVKWGLAIKNGELLPPRSAGFRRLHHRRSQSVLQQNLVTRSIAVIVLRAKTNRLADLIPLVRGLLGAIATAKPGVVHTLSASRNRDLLKTPAPHHCAERAPSVIVERE